MWILFKLSISVAAFFSRLLDIRWDKGALDCSIPFEGLFLEVRTNSNKHGITGTSLEAPLKCRSVFKITRESFWDQTFKQIGITEEFETGDRKFDTTVYIASDCAAFRQELKNDVASRNLILSLFEADCKFISCNGDTLRANFPGDQRNDNSLVTTFVKLHGQLRDVDTNWRGLFRDKFFLKHLLIESTVWSIFAYAAAGLFEWMVFSEDLHLSPELVLRHGLFAGAFVFALLLAAIVVILQGSSRGHRIIVESFVVLALAIPMGGVHLVSDLNTRLDISEPYLVRATVSDLYKRQHRGRRGRTYYTYHLHINSITNSSEIDVPRHIQISSSVFQSLKQGNEAALEIGRGYLRHPWFRSIEPSPPPEL